MKKKLVISNIVILFVSLFAMFFSANLIANNSIEESAKKEINNYLNVALNIYDGTNEKTTAYYLVKNNKEIRVTFINASSYEVIYDYGYSVDVESYENHIDRPELLNLGKVYIRYSKSLNVKMMYIADVKEGTFVRISIPLSNLSKITNEFMLYALIIWIIISFISAILTYEINKKTIKPINQEIKKLASITGETTIEDINIDKLPIQVEKTRKLIQDKINTIVSEKEKFSYVINNIPQGFIIVDKLLNIYMINKISLFLFKEEKDIVIGKNIIYLYNNQSFLNDVKKALESKSTFSSEYIINKKAYLISFNYLDETWEFEGVLSGVLIMIMDINSVNQVEMMKKDFFSNASHELKSPLTTIIGNLQMISKGIVCEKSIEDELINNCEKEALRMSKIITDMLELAYLESNQKIETKKIDIKSLIEEIISKFEYQIKTKNIHLNLSLEEYVLEINPSDAYYLISNLIDNAIKYNKHNGSINVSLNNNMLIVSDSGIGIDNSDLERIFERFYRVDKSRSKELGGTGLGLSIVKHICNRYHYDVLVNSEKNQGSTFKILF